MEANKLWTREFIVVALINFLLTIQFFLLMITISTYAIKTHGVTISSAGLVVSIFVIGSLLGRLLAGRLIAHFGALNVLVNSLIIFIFVSSGYFFAKGIEMLVLTRLLQGFVVGIISTATGTISVQVAPPSRKGEGIAYYSLSAVIGSAIGPFIGIYLLELENSFQWIFFMNIVVGVICLSILKLARLRASLIEISEKIQIEKSFSLKSMIDTKTIPIAIIALTIGFGYSSVSSYVALYSKEIHLVQAASYYFLVHAICVTFSRPFTGKLVDSKGANIIIYPCMVLFVMGLIVYSQASSAWMLLGAAALMGAGFGNFNSASQIIAVRFTPPHRLGIATATYWMFMDLGFGLGPYVLGFVVEHAGFRILYTGVACMVLICIPIYYMLYGRKEKEVLQQLQQLQQL